MPTSSPSTRSRNPRAAARLVAAVAVVLALALTAGACSTGKKKRPRRPTSEEQYKTAMELMERHNYTRARTVLGNIGVRELQDSELDPKVKIALADAYYLDGGITNVIEAQARYEQFINFYPTSPQVAYAQFQVGMCLLGQSASPANDQIETRRALGEFAKVSPLDPTSEWAARAETQMTVCQEKLARHEYDVGRFYLRRKDCTAAAGRFKTILEEFPKFSLVDGATWYMAQSLLCSNNTEESKIYLEKLAAEFPDSPFTSKNR